MLNKIFFLSLCSTLLSPVYGMDRPDEKISSSKQCPAKGPTKTALPVLKHKALKKIFANMTGAEIQEGHFYAFKGSIEKYNEIAGILEKEKDVNAIFQGENFCGSANTLGEGFSRDLVKYALYLNDGMAQTPMLYQVRLTNSKNPAVKEDVELLLYLRKEEDRDDQLLCKVKNKPDPLVISKSGDPHTSTVHGCAADTYDAIVNELKSMTDSSPQSLDPASTWKVLQYTRLHNYTENAALFFEVSFLTKKPQSRETDVGFLIRKLTEECQSPKIMRTFTYSYSVFTDEEYLFYRLRDSIDKNNVGNNVKGIYNFLCQLHLEGFPNGMPSEATIQLADLQEKLDLPPGFNQYLSDFQHNSTRDKNHSSKNRLNLSSMTIDDVKDLDVENFAQRLLEEDIKQFKDLRIDTIIRTSKDKKTSIVTSGEEFIGWVQAIIISAQEKERREQVLQKFMDIAGTLFKKNNFHGAYQFVQAFQGHEVVQALKSHGADKLSSNIEWGNLRNALAMNNNFRNYRALKNNAQKESLPYLPIFLVIVKDFTNIREQYLLAPPDDRIKALEVIAEILRECFYLKSYRKSLPSSTIKKTLAPDIAKKKTSKKSKKRGGKHKDVVNTTTEELKGLEEKLLQFRS